MEAHTSSPHQRSPRHGGTTPALLHPTPRSAPPAAVGLNDKSFLRGPLARKLLIVIPLAVIIIVAVVVGAVLGSRAANSNSSSSPAVAQVATGPSTPGSGNTGVLGDPSGRPVVDLTAPPRDSNGDVITTTTAAPPTPTTVADVPIVATTTPDATMPQTTTLAETTSSTAAETTTSSTAPPTTTTAETAAPSTTTPQTAPPLVINIPATCGDSADVLAATGKTCAQLKDTSAGGCDFPLANLGRPLPANIPAGATLALVCADTCGTCPLVPQTTTAAPAAVWAEPTLYNQEGGFCWYAYETSDFCFYVPNSGVGDGLGAYVSVEECQTTCLQRPTCTGFAHNQYGCWFKNCDPLVGANIGDSPDAWADVAYTKLACTATAPVATGTRPGAPAVPPTPTQPATPQTPGGEPVPIEIPEEQINRLAPKPTLTGAQLAACVATGCSADLLQNDVCDNACNNKACMYDSTDCGCFFPEIDALAGDLGQMYAPAPSTCSSTCAKLTGCAAYAYVLGVCYFKTAQMTTFAFNDADAWAAPLAGSGLPGCASAPKPAPLGRYPQPTFTAEQSAKCAATGCDLSLLENDLCDALCNNADCYYDNLKCGCNWPQLDPQDGDTVQVPATDGYATCDDACANQGCSAYTLYANVCYLKSNTITSWAIRDEWDETNGAGGNPAYCGAA